MTRDLALEKSPIEVKIAATIMSDKGEILAGAIPLYVLVIDPLGVVRHQVYRATENGQFAIALPLAANDAAGQWSVVAINLLAPHPGIGVAGAVATFHYQPPAQARAIAGATPRAISFGDDAAKVFRFARTFHEATIVKGKSAFNDAAAKRLARILAPWGVKCKELDLAEASKARSLSEDEARTWIGLAYTGTGQIKPGDKNRADPRRLQRPRPGHLARHAARQSADRLFAQGEVPSLCARRGQSSRSRPRLLRLATRRHRRRPGIDRPDRLRRGRHGRGGWNRLRGRRRA